MILTNRFRTSTFLSLASASAALGVAESTVFPEIGFAALVVGVALYVIYRLNRRAESLSITSANLLGIVITLGYILWASYRILREARLHQFDHLGWQLLILPFLGPVLMLSVPAKLLRQGKTTRDWWMLHAIAFAQVCVAATIGYGPTVLALVGIYSVLAIWSLAEFYICRNAVRSLAPNLPTMPHIESRWLLGPVVACAGLAVLFAIPLYLVTPRSSAERLQFGNPRVEIGFASNHMVDLRRTVELQDNPDPVFEVQTEYCDGRIKEDLDLSQYWRGAILTRYHQGIWIPERHRLPTAVETPRGDPGESWQPPDFGPNTYRIRYTLLTEERASFLAVPVIWASSQPVPVATICGSGLRGWTTALDGSGNFHRAHCGNPRAIPRQYVQYSRSGTESDLGPAFQLLKSARPEERLRDLITNYPLRVREYTDRLLIRLVEQGRLPPHAVPTGDPDLGIRRVPDECQEAVARAFADYLANDPSFHYTTQLQRITPDIDPIVEFLFELKRGHCERFATALVMMLRSQGIPAVFVLGFRGCEQIAPGRGVVRQRDAHAWVEVLISRPARGMTHGDPAADWHWLSLDPTPSHSSNNHAVGQSKSIWTRSLEWVSNTVQHYVHNYTSSRRELTLQAMRDLIASPSFLLGSGAFVVVVWGVRYMVRRRAIVSRNDVPDAFAWFERLLSVVGSSGLIRTVDQTPFEFAHMVANALRHRSELAPLAHIPIEWALAYYHMRYGLHPLTTDQRARLSASLDRLANALRNQPFLNRSCP